MLSFNIYEKQIPTIFMCLFDGYMRRRNSTLRIMYMQICVPCLFYALATHVEMAYFDSSQNIQEINTLTWDVPQRCQRILSDFLWRRDDMKA